MKKSSQCGNTYIECSQQEYDDLAFRDKLEPDTTYVSLLQSALIVVHL